MAHTTSMQSPPRINKPPPLRKSQAPQPGLFDSKWIVNKIWPTFSLCLAFLIANKQWKRSFTNPRWGLFVIMPHTEFHLPVVFSEGFLFTCPVDITGTSGWDLRPFSKEMPLLRFLACDISPRVRTHTYIYANIYIYIHIYVYIYIYIYICKMYYASNTRWATSQLGGQLPLVESNILKFARK